MRNQRSVQLLFSALLTLSFFGCANMDRKEKGAAAGAAVGGLVGGASRGGTGALIGAAAGALGGGLLGAYLDQRQNELAKFVKTERTPHGLMVTLKSDLLFDFGKTDLKSNAQSNLIELAGILGKYPKDKLRVEGYTDHIGAEAFNKKLSAARAESVRSFLASNGVNNQMSAVGMGEIPGKGNDPALVAQDRKVEIYIDVAAPESKK